MTTVNLLVPGLANLQDLARALHAAGHLNLFAYSHALRTTPASLGLPDTRAVNLPLKEHLVRAHLMAFGWALSDRLFPLYYKLWSKGVLSRWSDAAVTHVLLWGAAIPVLRAAKHRGSTTLGLVVNAHPRVLDRLLDDEADRLGVTRRHRQRRLDDAILGEVALCDHLHAESEFTRQSYIAQGFPPDRIHVGRRANDMSRFHPASAEERLPDDGRFRVICVGYVSLRKGQVHLLEAWRRLALPNAELTLIGSISDEIKALLRPYAGLFTHVKSVPNQHLRGHFLRSSVAVTPSIEDGYAMVVGEALCCGVPVITTTNTGAAELIRDGVNGYVVAPSSPEAIAEKLLALHGDRALLTRLGAGARATIPAIGSWTERAGELVDLYRRIARQ